LIKPKVKNIKKSNWRIDINYSGKPSPNGFPDDLPPKTINGYHPDFGQRDNMYNTLDDISAMAMPGGMGYNSNITTKDVVKINKKKFEEKYSNWRQELINEGMTTKDFEYISSFGVYTISSVLSADKENAQAILQGSKELTDYKFGIEFPGSYVNNISINSEIGAELPSSYNKIDIQMALQPSADNSIADIKSNISSWANDPNVGGSYGNVNLLNVIQKLSDYPYGNQNSYYFNGAHNNNQAVEAAHLRARLVWIRDIKNWIRETKLIKAGNALNFGGTVMPGWPNGIGSPPTDFLYVVPIGSDGMNAYLTLQGIPQKNGLPTKLIFGTPNTLAKFGDLEMRYNSDGFLDFSEWTPSERSKWYDKSDITFQGDLVKINGYSDSFGKLSKTTDAYDLGMPVSAFNSTSSATSKFKYSNYLKSLPPGVRNDMLRGGKTASPLGDLGIMLAAALAGRSIAKSPENIRGYSRRGMLNPFGQTNTVRSGAAGRQRVDVYRGRPYQGDLKLSPDKPAFASTRSQTGATYTKPGTLRGIPGTGGIGSNVKIDPKGTLDKGSLPQRYIDKYGGRSVLGQQQIKMSPSAAAKTFGGMVNQPSKPPTIKPSGPGFKPGLSDVLYGLSQLQGSTPQSGPAYQKAQQQRAQAVSQYAAKTGQFGRYAPASRTFTKP